jgi:hypothetical protein
LQYNNFTIGQKRESNLWQAALSLLQLILIVILLFFFVAFLIPKNCWKRETEKDLFIKKGFGLLWCFDDFDAMFSEFAAGQASKWHGTLMRRSLY